MPCECGCGKDTQGGAFLPGHDQTLRINLESRVGGLLALRDLVESMENYIQEKSDSEAMTRKSAAHLRTSSAKPSLEAGRRATYLPLLLAINADPIRADPPPGQVKPALQGLNAIWCSLPQA